MVYLPYVNEDVFLKFDVDENLFGQYGHECGRSPF